MGVVLATAAAANVSTGRMKVVVLLVPLPLFSFLPFFFTRGSRVSERTSGICTRTSVQVAIGLFPIDSVRGESLSSFPLPFPPRIACSLHPSFTCLHLPSFFSLFLSLQYSSRYSAVCPSLFPSPSSLPFSEITMPKRCVFKGIRGFSVGIIETYREWDDRVD